SKVCSQTISLLTDQLDSQSKSQNKSHQFNSLTFHEDSSVNNRSTNGRVNNRRVNNNSTNQSVNNKEYKQESELEYRMPVYMTISNTMTLMEDHHLTAELSRCISSNNLTDQVESTTTLKFLVSGMSSGSTVQKIIESGVIYTLINFLQSDDSQLQNEALFALCNIATIMGAHTKTVVSAGGVGSLVALIRHSAHQELWYTAAWALSNIVTDSCAGRDLILSYDALTPLIRMLNESENKGVTTASWLLRNLCLPQHNPVDLSQMVRCVPTICDLIFHRDAQVAENALLALTDLTTTHKHQLQAAICPEFYPKLLQFRKLNPGRKVTKLVNVLKKLQPAVNVNNQVIGAISVSPGTTLSIPRKTPLAKTIKKSTVKRYNCPFSWDITTRSMSKRLRDASGVRNDVPLRRVIRTRASTKKLILGTPDQSLSSSVQKKV
ncbi:hypothetical protein OTU49_012361, partial [Cherax quadricarinatus]